MNWQEARHLEENKYDLPGSWLHLHYFEAFNILFRLENALRLFVYIILKNAYQEKWTDLSVTSDDEDQSTISATAKKRINQDNNFAYLGYNGTNPLMYLTSGELIRIITSDAYWKLFKNYFRGSKEIMRNKLDEIGNVRNALAHFRPINSGDVELIKQNANHALLLIEQVIVQLIQCPDNVPSNNEEKWFLALKAIGSKDIAFRFRQSKDGRWVAVTLTYNSCVISLNEHYQSHVLARATRLNVGGLLQISPAYRNHLLICREGLIYLGMETKESMKFIKNVEMVFSRECLQQNHELLRSELETIVNKITEETELIRTDDLAKGVCIDAVNVWARVDEKTNALSINSTVLDSPEMDFPEFWGTITYFSDNFISNVEKFPWMPTSISEDKEVLPF